MNTLSQETTTNSETFTNADEARLDGVSFKRLIENIADGILVVDLDGRVLYANPAAAHILGQSLDELLHVPLGRPVVSGDSSSLTIHRQGRRSAEVEMRVVEVTWGGTPMLLATLRDMSAQRAIEERHRQSQKLEAVGRLAAGIVHDLKNLIAVFESGLRLLRDRLANDPANPENALLVEEMLKRTANGNALTQRLLAISRKQPLTPEIVKLNERIESLGSLLGRTLGNGIKVERKLDPNLGDILIDANQLDIAVLNLAVNARDAMCGNGLLTIETSDVPDDLDEVHKTYASFVRITVSDTGRGMSKDVLSHVFEPFFTTKEEGEGTGLGLSQVYGFVKQSGGHVKIDSEVARGTSVHLFLPRAQGREGDQRQTQEASVSRSSASVQAEN